MSACNGSDDAALATTTELSPATTIADTAVPSSESAVSSSTSSPSTTTPATIPPSTTPDVATTAPADVDWAMIGGDLYRQAVDLPKNPSLEAVATLCLAGSQCEQDQTATVDFLLDADARVEGGPEFVIDTVEYQGTLDGVPVDEALDVTLIIRLTATTVEDSRVVKADGTVEATIAPDSMIVMGEQYSQTVSLGRASPSDDWQLSALGALS